MTVRTVLTRSRAAGAWRCFNIASRAFWVFFKMAIVLPKRPRRRGWREYLGKTSRLNKKKICVSDNMLLKIRVGRWDFFIFLFFEIILFARSTFFYKTELVYLHFSVCHVVSRLFAPLFSLANSLISADVLSAARKRYKNTSS